MLALLRYVSKLLTLVPILVMRQLSRLIPRDKNQVCAGAWFGNLYADNPKHLTEYLLSNSDLIVTWIGNAELYERLPKHPNLRFARKGSLRAAISLLRAKFWICCVGRSNDLTSLPIDGGAVVIDPWHGIPIKNLGQNSIWDRESRFGKGLKASLERIYSLVIAGPKEWVTLSSPDMAPIMMYGFRTICTPSKFLNFGSPRIDFLVNNKSNTTLKASIKAKYAKLLNFPAEAKIILYAPTWRVNAKCPFCFYNLSKAQSDTVVQLLKDNSAVIIEKHHTHTLERFTPNLSEACSIPITPKIEKSVDTQELLLIADMLITDYSSIYLDYTVLARPIIHFTYDINDYKQDDMGLAYRMQDVCGGPIVSTFEELLSTIAAGLNAPLYMPGPLTDSLCRYETGKSCEQLLAFMKAF